VRLKCNNEYIKENRYKQVGGLVSKKKMNNMVLDAYHMWEWKGPHSSYVNLTFVISVVFDF